MASYGDVSGIEGGGREGVEVAFEGDDDSWRPSCSIKQSVFLFEIYLTKLEADHVQSSSQ